MISIPVSSLKKQMGWLNKNTMQLSFFKHLREQSKEIFIGYIIDLFKKTSLILLEGFAMVTVKRILPFSEDSIMP